MIRKVTCRNACELYCHPLPPVCWAEFADFKPEAAVAGAVP